MRVRNWLVSLAGVLLLGAAGCAHCKCGKTVAAPVAPPEAKALTLVKDGAPASVIVIADPAPDAVQLGAQELQYHVEKMSGAKLPIVSAADAPKDGTALILIGRSALTDALGMDPSKLAAEGYMIKTAGNALVLLGDEAKDPARALKGKMDDNHGSLMAVYGLLEDQLGCHWIWPGVTGESIPKRATVVVAPLDIVSNPALQRRHIRMVMNRQFGPSTVVLGDAPLKQLAQDEAVWYRRMRMGRSVPTPQGHSFTTWWNAYKDDHPNIFAMLPDGKREPADPKKPDFVKMCVASPELWDFQIEQFKKLRAKDPSRHDLSCNEDDGSAGFCTCPLCKAWDVTADKLPADVLDTLDDVTYKRLLPDKNGIPTCLSPRYAKWFNEMARRVKEVDPEGYVTSYAYTRYKDNPITVKLEPNMIIGYQGFTTYPKTPAMTALDRRNYMGWAQPGIKLYIRPNAPHYMGDGHPYTVAREMAADMVFASNHGMCMADIDSLNGYWAAWGPTFYVLPHIFWEGGNSDIDKLLDNWYGAFGPAQRKIRAYYDYWEQYIIWVKTAPDNEKRQGLDDVYTPEVLAGARKLVEAAMDDAKKANADESVMAKVQNVEMCLHDTELTVKAVQLAKADPRDDQALKAALTELVALRKEMAPRNVVNVYKMIDCESGKGGYWKGPKLPWELIADTNVKDQGAQTGPLLDQ